MNNRIATFEGIVIKRRNYGEADKLISVFTKEEGKIRVLAKGIRKLTSRRAGHTELFNHLKITVVKHRDLYILSEAVSYSKNISIENDLDRIIYLYCIAEIIDHLVLDDQALPDVYFLFKSALQDIYDMDINLLTKKFPVLISEILSVLGFLPPGTDDISLIKILHLVEKFSEKKLKVVRLLDMGNSF